MRATSEPAIISNKLLRELSTPKPSRITGEFSDTDRAIMAVGIPETCRELLRFRESTQRSNLPNVAWNVTVRMPDGSIDTKVVEIDGGSLQTDTDTLCRIALAEQHCMEAKEVLQITLGRTPSPHKLQRLKHILNAFRTGTR